MRFTIKRTSTWLYEDAPMDGAFRCSIPRWDFRTFKTFDAFEKRVGEPFTVEGTEHRKTPDGIERCLGEQEVWAIEIPDLDALIALFEEHGDLVLTTAMWTKDQLEIEIYDNWRE